MKSNAELAGAGADMPASRRRRRAWRQAAHGGHRRIRRAAHARERVSRRETHREGVHGRGAAAERRRSAARGSERVVAGGEGVLRGELRRELRDAAVAGPGRPPDGVLLLRRAARGRPAAAAAPAPAAWAASGSARPAPGAWLALVSASGRRAWRQHQSCSPTRATSPRRGRRPPPATAPGDRGRRRPAATASPGRGPGPTAAAGRTRGCRARRGAPGSPRRAWPRRGPRPCRTAARSGPSRRAAGSRIGRTLSRCATAPVIF